MKKENTIYIIMILYILLNLVCVNILFSNVYDSYFELFPVNDSEDTYRLVDMEESVSSFATVYKGNIIKNLIMDCQSYTKYRPNETTGGIFVSWRRKEELPTGA